MQTADQPAREGKLLFEASIKSKQGIYEIWMSTVSTWKSKSKQYLFKVLIFEHIQFRAPNFPELQISWENLGIPGEF